MKYLKIFLPRKRSRTSKKILWFFAIFALSGAFFQGNVGMEGVHAQPPVQTENSTSGNSVIDKMWLVELLDLILKVIYILLWPLLVVAWRALDNTLVYGSLFHLDVPLWKFRNILKNFANFTLWFLVLFAILKSIFTNSWMWSLKDKDGKSPLSIIKKTLVAGILIQASRFLLAATIDVSTVATYAVGGLPLSVLKTTTLWQKKILAVDANIDLNKIQNLNDKWDILSLTYSAWPHKLSACKIMNDNCSWDYRYIIWRKQMSGTEMGKCVFGGNTVVLYDETWFQNDAYFGGMGPTITYNDFVQGEWLYGGCINAATMDWWISKWFVVDIYSWASFWSGRRAWQNRFNGTPAMKLSELVNRSKWFVWPMVMIYSSLLNFAEISDTGNDSFGKMSGEMIIRTAFALMLFFPLLALAVVLIIRVWFLRLVIAASPFIVLLETFKETLKLPKDMKIMEHLKLGNIFSVIFAPVVTVFALSLAVIFITTLINTFTPKTTTTNTAQDTTQITWLEPTIQKLPSDGWTQKYLVWGSQMSLTNFNRWGTLDRFSRIIVNLISVWLMRALVFAAIKANTLGQKFGAPIEKFGSWFMQTLPIFNTPFGKTGINAVLQEPGNLIWRGNWSDGKIIEQIKTKESQVVDKLMKERFGLGEWETQGALTQEQVKNIFATPPTTKEAVTSQFAAQWVTDIWAAVTNNGTMIYNEIMNNKSIKPEDRANIWKVIGEAANDKTWRETMVKNDATTKFTDLFKNEKVQPDTKETIEPILNQTTESKAVVEALLNTDTKRTYEHVVNNKTFTISKDGSGKYIATEKPATAK